MARLPNPGSDHGQWGDILNDYLAQSLDAGGGIKSAAIGTTQLQDGSVTVSKLSASGPVNGQVLAYNGSGLAWTTVSGGTVPDADSSTKGIIQLTGALGGTASSPTVPGLAAKENTITAGTTGQYYRGDKSWQTLDKTAVGLGNVDNTSDATKNSASVTLTNKTISGGSNTITGIAQSSVTNLTTDLAGKASSTHNHAASDINSGTVATARLGSGTASASTVLLGDQTWGLAPLVSINAQSGTTYTLVLADAGKLITLTNGSAISMTVPTNASVAFPVGSSIKLAQMGSGQVTVVAAGGVSVFADPGLKIAAQYGAAELIKTATDTWLLVGRLAA